jgi:hypothetical protein
VTLKAKVFTIRKLRSSIFLRRIDYVLLKIDILNTASAFNTADGVASTICEASYGSSWILKRRLHDTKRIEVIVCDIVEIPIVNVHLRVSSH